MATELDRLRIVIEAENKATAALDQVKLSVASLAGAYISLQGVMMAYRATVAALQNAEAAAAEDVRLAVAIRTAGIEAAATVTAIHDLNAELARNTTFTDDAIARAQSYLISIGKLRGEGLERATRASADLAAAMGTDIAEAARQVATATDGTSRAFQLLNVSITDTMTPGEKFEALLQAIETRLGGVSVEVAKVQPWARWSKALDEANEAAGRWIGTMRFASGITVNEFLEDATAALQRFNEAASPQKGGGGIGQIAQSAADANAQFVPLIDSMRQLHVETVKVEADTPSIADEKAWAAAAREIRNALSALEAWQGPLQAGDQAVLDMQEDFRVLFEDINAGGKQTDEQFVAMRNSAADILSSLEAWQGPLTEAEASWERQRVAIDDLSVTLQSQASEAVATLGAGITRMWVEGEASFGRFIKSVLAGLLEAIAYAAILAALTYGGGGSSSYLSAFARLLGGGGGSPGGTGGGGGTVTPQATSIPNLSAPQSANINFFISGSTDAMVEELVPAIDNAVRRRGFSLSATSIYGGVVPLF